MSGSFEVLSSEQIERDAIYCGFSLSPKFNDKMGLDSNVTAFAKVIFERGRQSQAAKTRLAERNLSDAGSVIDSLNRDLEQASQRFQRAHLMAGQWQQRAELAERQRDELMALLGD